MVKLKITIVDSICGTGKTSWSIQYMNNNEEKKFIYITPYIDEVKRVKKIVLIDIFMNLI